MLVSHMDDLRTQLRAIEDSLQTNDALRELLSTREFQPLALRTARAKEAALLVKYHALNPTTWRALDHAAAMTSLYAAYERFVYQLLREWLSQLPLLCPRYDDLRQNIHKAHRVGTANIIQKKDHQRYRGLSLTGILRELASAADGVQPYRLLPEAFFSEDDNLRKDPLEALFGRVGFENTWKWIIKHPAVVDFIDNVRGGGNTAEGELAQFINYRNDAAHGNVDTVLGLNAIIGISTFVERLCEAITEFVRHTLLDRYLATGRATTVAEITEVFHHGATGIGTMRAGTIRVHDELALVAEDRCPMTEVLSLRDNDVDRQEVVAAQGQEVGIRLTIHVREGMTLVRVLSDDEAACDYVI